MIKTCCSGLALFFLLVVPHLAIAGATGLDGITAENFDSTYQGVTTRLNEIENTLGTKTLSKYRQKKGHKKAKLSATELQYKEEYLKLTEQKKYLSPVFELRESLKENYLKQYSKDSTDLAALHAEATRLSVGLVNEIADLKVKYHSFFIPIAHNMMISVGLRKRGACKHWAEDLLNYLRPKERQFFDVTWGQANSRKFNEHNVAVVIPRGKEFAAGMFIDPWRTSGKPFWLPVPDDKHYRWENWVEYGVY